MLEGTKNPLPHRKSNNDSSVFQSVPCNYHWHKRCDKNFIRISSYLWVAVDRTVEDRFWTRVLLSLTDAMHRPITYERTVTKSRLTWQTQELCLFSSSYAEKKLSQSLMENKNHSYLLIIDRSHLCVRHSICLLAWTYLHVTRYILGKKATEPSALKTLLHKS